MTRARVMPARKVPFATGVITTPSRTRKALVEAVSATCPSWSSESAFWKPRARASRTMRALLG